MLSGNPMLGRIDVGRLKPKRQRHEIVRGRQLGTCLTSRGREHTSLDASARTLNIYSPTTVRLIILVVLVFSTGGARECLGTLTSAQPLGYFTLVVVRKYDGMIPGCLLGLCTIRYTPGYSHVIDSPYFSSDRIVTVYPVRGMDRG